MDPVTKASGHKIRNTVLLVSALVLLALVSFIVVRKLEKEKEPALYVSVKEWRKDPQYYDLSVDTEFILEDGYGGYNVVEIKNGAVSVTAANCPDQICVYSYPLSEAGFGGIIACLPHGLYITVVSEEDMDE